MLQSSVIPDSFSHIYAIYQISFLIALKLYPIPHAPCTYHAHIATTPFLVYTYYSPCTHNIHIILYVHTMNT